MSEDKGAPAASDLGVPAARAQADAQGPATAGPSAKMKHTLQNVKLPIRGLNNRRWEAECEAQVSRMTEYLTRRAMNGMRISTWQILIEKRRRTLFLMLGVGREPTPLPGDCRGRILEFLNPSGPAVAPFLNLEEQEDFEAKVDAEHRRAGHAIRISGLGRPGVRELRTTFGNHVGPVDQVFFNEVQDKTIG